MLLKILHDLAHDLIFIDRLKRAFAVRDAGLTHVAQDIEHILHQVTLHHVIFADAAGILLGIHRDAESHELQPELGSGLIYG